MFFTATEGAGIGASGAFFFALVRRTLTLEVLVVQIGLISPPVGMNLFVLNALLKDVSLQQIFRGVWLFVAALVVGLFVCLEFQGLSLWLPSFMR